MPATMMPLAVSEDLDAILQSYDDQAAVYKKNSGLAFLWTGILVRDMMSSQLISLHGSVLFFR